MKKNKRLFRRLCSLFFVFLLIIPVPISVSAVSYDYIELNPEIVVDGSNDNITLNLDVSKVLFSMEGNTSNGSVTVPGNYATWISVYPLGGYDTGREGPNVLDGFDIPSGTTFTMTFRLDFDTQLSPEGGDTVVFEPYLNLYSKVPDSWIRYDDQNAGHIGTVVPNFTTSAVVSVPYSKPNFEPVYICPWVYIKTIYTEHPCKITATSCKMEFSISSLYRQQMLTGKTNKLLSEVNKQLEANGQKLEDILQSQQNAQEYIPQVSAPPVQGDLDNLQDVEDNLMNDVNAGFDKAHEFQEAAGGVITSLYIPIMAVSSLLSQLIGLDTSQIPGFYQILMVSMGLGLVGVLLNLGVNYVRSKAGDH